MSSTLKALWAILIIGLFVGGIALSMWGISAPKGEVRKEYVIPKEKAR